jgi:purine-binding chemotaxis protein CheW
MEQVLVFSLGEDLYGLDVVQVQEIVESPHLNFIPRAPAYFLGAINFHGQVVPILDLPRYLGMKPQKKDHRVIALASALGAVALAVSTIGRILPVDPESLQPAHDAEGENPFVSAELTHEDQRIILLDAARLQASLDPLSNETGGDHGA